MVSVENLAFTAEAMFLSSDFQPTIEAVSVWDQRGTELAEPADITERLLGADGPGFALVRHTSAVRDWTDNADVRVNYYEEVLQLVQQLVPGARWQQPYGHIYRNEEIHEHDFSNPDGALGPPAVAVHNDFADDMTDGQLTVPERKYPDVTNAPVPPGQRLVTLQLWRSVSAEPLARMPLMVCDRTSIDPADLVYTPNPNAPTPFNMHSARPNQSQRWCYFSEQSSDEVLVFLGYDSDPPDRGVFRPTLHTAVDIPGSEGKHQRESLELRMNGYLPLPEPAKL